MPTFAGVSILLALAACSTVDRPHQLPPQAPFKGERSVERLLDDFLAALAARDEAALHRLRVTEDEYRRVIIPGTVPPGHTYATVGEKKSQYFWSMLNQKSKDFAFVILRDFGGRPLHRTGFSYTKPPLQYAGYSAYGEVRISVNDEAGGAGTVRTGWVAEVAGQYKFIGFEYDD